VIDQNTAAILHPGTLDVRPETIVVWYKKPATKRRHRRSILKSLIHIENNLDQTIRLGDLSDVASLSTFHFHRLFASYMKETVNEYICRRRMEMAALQLTSSDLSVTEIGLTNGYGTPASFAKTFKRYTGLSPSSYKKRTATISKESFLLDHIFLRGMQSKESRYVTDISPVIRYLPDRHALVIRKKGFFAGAFNQVIWEGMRELFQYIKEVGLTRFVGYPFTTCAGFPSGLNDPDAEIGIGVLLNQTIRPDPPFAFTTLNGGRYALYEYFEPTRLYKLNWEVFWHWQSLQQNTVDRRGSLSVDRAFTKSRPGCLQKNSACSDRLTVLNRMGNALLMLQNFTKFT
jgi:AraC family transcriptional regulator